MAFINYNTVSSIEMKSKVNTENTIENLKNFKTQVKNNLNIFKNTKSDRITHTYQNHTKPVKTDKNTKFDKKICSLFSIILNKKKIDNKDINDV